MLVRGSVVEVMEQAIKARVVTLQLAALCSVMIDGDVTQSRLRTE